MLCHAAHHGAFCRSKGIVGFAVDGFCIGINATGKNIVVPADSPYQSLQDLIQASKDKPNTIKFGISTGGGVYIASVIMAQNGAKFAAIKKSYRKLIVQYHPDKVGHLGEEYRRIATEKTKELNAAYRHLAERFGK